MLCLMIVLRILIFCLRLVGKVDNNSLSCLVLWVVISF